MQDITMLVLIFIPLSFFIGFGASAIGMTAWLLLVPLLFVVFGFDLYLTIFISLLVDLGNATTKTVNAAAKNMIDFRLGTRYAAFACLCILPGIWAGTHFIPQHTEFFKGSVGFFNMIFGIGFLIRGFKTAKGVPGEGGRIPGPVLSAPTNSSPDTPGKPNPENNPTAFRRYLVWPGIAFVALQTGLLGIGGGMMYAVCLIALLAFPTLKATGTAMFITSCSALLASVGFFFLIADTVPVDQSMVILILLFVSISVIGTLTGEKITHQLSETKINFLIGGVTLAASLLAIVQGVLLK